MKEIANKVAMKVSRWNARCSQAHDEYLGEITMLVFGEEYDYREQKNYISDYEKLSKIWQVFEYDNYSSKELIEKTKEIINM